MLQLLNAAPKQHPSGSGAAISLLSNGEGGFKNVVKDAGQRKYFTELHQEVDEVSCGEVDQPLALRKDGVEFREHFLESVLVCTCLDSVHKEVLPSCS